MISIKMLRKQHADLIEKVGTIGRIAEENGVEPNGEVVRDLLSKLSGELELHMLIEDDLLYPLLLKDSQEAVRTLANRFARELSGVKKAFRKYNAKWTNHEAIAESPKAFISETNVIAGILKKKIDKEHKELFPLLEKERAAFFL